MRLEFWKTGRLIGSMVLLTCLLTGCSSLFGPKQPKPEPKPEPPRLELRAGDRVRIDLTGTGVVIQPREEEIKTDGTINLEYIGSVQAAGKTARQVEEDIYAKYVPAIYRNITVTITPQEQVIYVGGQVNHPGMVKYNGKITVTKAIQAAGDFTDFANRGKVQLTRSTGEIVYVDFEKAVRNQAADPEVHPHDQVTVSRRF